MKRNSYLFLCDFDLLLFLLYIYKLRYFQASRSADPYAICVCRHPAAVCGEDGKTYKNRCDFDETMNGRSEKYRIVRDEPCDEG